MKKAALLFMLLGIFRPPVLSEDSFARLDLPKLLEHLSDFPSHTNKDGEVYSFNYVRATNTSGKALSVSVPFQLVNDFTFKILSQSESITNITLSFWGTDRPSSNFTIASYQYIARIPSLSRLHLACFSRLQKGTVAQVAKIDNLKELSLVSVQPGMSHDDFRELSASSVEILTLRCEELCDANIQALSQMPRLKELKVSLYGHGPFPPNLTNAFQLFPVLEKAKVTTASGSLNWQRKSSLEQGRE